MASQTLQYVPAVGNPPRHKMGAYHIHPPKYDDAVISFRTTPAVKYPGFDPNGAFDRTRHPGVIPPYKRVPDTVDF